MKISKTLLTLSMGLILPMGTATAAGGIDDVTMRVIENDRPQAVTQHIQLPPGDRDQDRDRDRLHDRQHEIGDAMHEQQQEMHEQRQEMQEHQQEQMGDMHDGMGGTHGGMGHR